MTMETRPSPQAQHPRHRAHRHQPTKARRLPHRSTIQRPHLHEDAAAAQVALGLDLTDINADRTRHLPMPTTVLVDAQDIIGWIDVHPNYTTRTEVTDILAAIDRWALSR
jgi:hypothetical protein